MTTSTAKQAAAIPTSLAPMLSVRHGSAAVGFYITAFGAKEIFHLENDGSVVARFSIGSSEFWIADESPDHQNFSPETLGGASTRMVLVVDNPDELYTRAVAAGATAISPVADQEYGWRVGRVLDPFGHHWEIARPLA